MRFEPLFRTPTAWSSVAERFAVHLFEGHVSVADMERMQDVGDRWTGEHGGKRVELVVVLPSGERMSHDERVRMAKLIKHGEAHRSASATVILAEGLVASMQRGMLTGMMMLAPAPHPAKVFGTLREAVKWLAPHVDALCPALRHELAGGVSEHVSSFQSRPDRPRFSLAARAY